VAAQPPGKRGHCDRGTLPPINSREAIAEEGRHLLGFAAGTAGHNIRISSLN
jgi:hypothetical protein